MGGPRIAACLIVGGSASATIARCLASVAQHVDEIDVLDTSEDRATSRVLEALKAQEGYPLRVESARWRDDFAWARERSFAMASDAIDWLLWLDADDVLEGRGSVREVAASAGDDCDGFALLYEADHDPDGNPISVVWRERLVRRGRGFRWQGAVHEVLVAPGGGRVDPLDAGSLRVVHRPARADWHPERNLELLRHEERRDAAGVVAPRTLFYLAGELAWRGEFGEAASYFRRYLGAAGPDWTGERLEAVERLTACLRASGDAEEALAVAREALRERAEWTPLVVAAAEAAVVLGDWDAAEAYSARALELGLPSSPHATLDPTRLRVLPAVRVAQAAARRGEYGDADAVLAIATRSIRNAQTVEATRRLLAEAAAEHDDAAAQSALQELAGRYDSELHAVVRGLRLQAERAAGSQSGPRAHA